MKKVRCLILLFGTILGALVTPSAWPQLNAGVLMRVVMIWAGSNVGTGFTIDVDGRQYLITAKHVTAGLKQKDHVQIKKGQTWIPLSVEVMRCADPIDIAVLVPPRQITVGWSINATTEGLGLGQDVYFVGFPDRKSVV